MLMSACAERHGLRLRSVRPGVTALGVALLVGWLGLARPGLAQSVDVKVLLDLDSNDSTGCSVVTPAGTFAGADQVLLTTVDEASSTVTAVQIQACVGGSLGSPTPLTGPFVPPWPVGPGNGAWGSTLIETYFPLGLAPFVAGSVRVGFVLADANGDEDALLPSAQVPTDGAATQIPTLSAWGALLLAALLLFAGFAVLRRHRTGATALLGLLLVLTGLSGVAWAAIVLDGQASDWAGISPLESKAPSPSPTHPELLAAYGTEQTGNLFFRVDAMLCPAISVSPTNLLDGTVGTAYPDTTFTASGGAGAYAWSWTGSLPSGMTVSPAGELSGTPTESGTFTFTVTATDANGCTGSQQITFNVCVTPSVTIAASATTVCAGTLVTFTAAPVAGGAAPSYQWHVNGGAVGSDSPTFASSTLADGDHVDVVMTSNASPCISANPVTSNVVTMTVNANPATPAITPAPAEVCADSTGNQASGPAGATTYAWSITNGTITSATNIQTITYTAGPSGTVGLTLTVSNASGCSATNSTNVTVNANPATPTITPTPSSVCADSTGNQASGPAGASIYAWGITNGTITSATNIQTITYTAGPSGTVGLTLTVTNASGCTATNTANVTINANPATPGIAASGVQAVTVTGGAGSFTLTFNGATTGSLAYNASAASVQTALNALSSIGGVGGSASVVLSGTVYSVSFGGTLAGPQPQLTGSGSGGATVAIAPIVCADSTGNQASGPAGATTYAWGITNGAITSATDVQSITYTAGSSGTVGLTLTVTNASGCSASTSLGLTINDNPATPTITPSASAVCAGSTGNTADGPAGATTYAWGITNGTITSATNIQTITWTAGSVGTTTLTLTVGNDSGCTATNSADVTVNAAPATPAITTASTVCSASTGNTADGPAGASSYDWSITGGTITSATNIQSITYTAAASGTVDLTLTVTNANGCPATNSTSVAIDPAITVARSGGGSFPAGTYNVAYAGQSVTATGGDGSFTFALTGGTFPSGLNLAANGGISGTPTATGTFTFTVKATDTDGCTGSQSFTIAVNPVAMTDSYGTLVDNTQAAVTGGLTSSPTTPFVALTGTILGNDAPSGGVTVTTGTFATTAGGSVTIASDGSFLYTPKANPTAAATTSDSFTYQISSNTGGTPTATTATGTVNLSLSGRVWYVKNDGSAGNGQSQSPFNTLSAAIAASTTSDTIFVYRGDGSTTNLATASTLKTSQNLIGEGAGLTVNAHSLVAAGGFPQIGNTVTLAGSVTINGIDMTTGTNAGISGGSVSGDTVTVRNLTSTTGTAVSLNGTGGTFTFTSVSANGAAVGISLANTTGSFTVTGDGGSTNNGSGGTIQNATSGIQLSNVQNISLDQMNIHNTTRSGINGTRVTNFALTNSTIDTTGTQNFDANVAFNTTNFVGAQTQSGNNINGTLTITGNALSHGYGAGLDIQSDDGTITNANVSNNTVSNTGANTAALSFVGIGNGTTVFNLNNATIANNVLTGDGAGGIQIEIGNSSTAGGAVAHAGFVTIDGSGRPISDPSHIISITGNSITGIAATGTQAITVANSGANASFRTQTNFEIKNNGTVATPLGSSSGGTVILIGNNGYADMAGVVDNNVILATHTPNFTGANGIAGGNGVAGSGNAWTPRLNLTVTNNSVQGTDGNGILLVGRGTSGFFNLKIAGNAVSAPVNAGGTARQGIRVDAGNASSADDGICLDISGNTSAGSNGASGIGLRKQGTVATTNDFGLQGITPNPPSNTDVVNWVNGLNTGGTDIISGSNFVQCSSAP
jgi:hypothetical protein